MKQWGFSHVGHGGPIRRISSYSAPDTTAGQVCQLKCCQSLWFFRKLEIPFFFKWEIFPFLSVDKQINFYLEHYLEQIKHFCGIYLICDLLIFKFCWIYSLVHQAKIHSNVFSRYSIIDWIMTDWMNDACMIWVTFPITRYSPHIRISQVLTTVQKMEFLALVITTRSLL